VQLDTEFLQVPGGQGGELGAECGQRRAAAVEQQDPRLLRLDVPVFPAQRLGGDLPDLPASSTPVGPAPTSANVSQRCRSSGSAELSAISNAPKTRLRMARASAIVFMPGANRAYSSCPKYDCCTPAARISQS
jgi:hypothetical protein